MREGVRRGRNSEGGGGGGVRRRRKRCESFLLFSLPLCHTLLYTVVHVFYEFHFH